MQSLLRATSLGCVALSAAVVDAKLVKWERDASEEHWLPPRETLGLQPLLIGISPAPTPAPALPPRAIFDKRGATDNTCAFISGSSDYPLYCGTASSCVYHTGRSAFGCCPDNPTATNDICQAWTTCYNSAQVSSFTTNNGLTLWCGSSAYPSCFKHTFADTAFSGYSLWGCAKTGGTGRVYNRATDTTSSTPSTKRTTTPTTTDPADSTVALGVGSTSTATGSGSGSTQQQDQSSSSTPIGPIVGGAVGGFAVLAILAFAVFFLVRRSRKTAASHPLQQQQQSPPPQPPMGGGASGPYPPPAGSPQMMQQQGQQQYPGPYGFVPVMGDGGNVNNNNNNDPRASIAKPPYGGSTVTTHSVYDPNMPVSPPHSPTPQSHLYSGATPPPPHSYQQHGGGPDGGNASPYSAAAAAWAVPPQQQQQGPPGYQPPGQQQQQQQQQQYGGAPPAGYPPQQRGSYATELPTGRGDGELRELA